MAYQEWLEKMEATQKYRQNLLLRGCEKYAAKKSTIDTSVEKDAVHAREIASLFFNDRYRVIYNHVRGVILNGQWNNIMSQTRTGDMTELHIRRLSVVDTKSGHLNRLDVYTVQQVHLCAASSRPFGVGLRGNIHGKSG